MTGIPQVGQDYSYAEVRAFYMPDVTALHFVLIKDGKIVALRVREDYNPNIFNDPAEVWVGAKGEVKTRGDELADRDEPAPLFVKKRDREEYTFMGNYQVRGSKTEGEAVTNARAAMKKVHKQGVSRIVIMKKRRAAGSSL